MLTNPEAGVSEGQGLDAESVFARMNELDGDQPEDEQEASEVEQEEVAAAPPEDDLEEVEHDGKKYKIPKAVKPALMFQSDYTKKTQALAEQRKAFDEHEKAVQAERQYYANQLAQFTQHLAQAIQQGPTEEQLVELSKKDPIAYIRARAERDTWLAQLQQAQQQAQQIQQKQEADYKRQQADYITKERATLLDKVPEWKDAAVQQREFEELSTYAQSIGYTPEELANVYNHRDYLVLRDAMRYRQLLSSKENQSKQVQAQPPKTLKPGAAQVPDGKKVPDKLVSQFRKDPTIRNAASIFDALG